MADKNGNKGIFRWALFFGFVLVVIYVYIVHSYVGLLTNERTKYLNVVEENEVTTVEMRGHRGNIYDCKGRLVSATLPMYELYMDLTIPYLHEGAGKETFEEKLDSLCNQLYARFGEEKPDVLKKRLMAAYKRNSIKKGDNGVRLIKKTLSYDEYQDVRQMALMRLAPARGGRVVNEKHNRENLFGLMAQRVVGAVHGTDDSGRSLGYYGLEKYFDDELSGTKGIYTKRRVGSTYLLYPVVEAEDGCDVVMTLDMDIQDICESTLREKLRESGAESACMILMEVETGEIKAMVNFTQDTAGIIRQGTNLAASMNNQPGSTFKTVALMAALEHGGCDTSTMVRVNGGKGSFGGVPLNDSHTYPEMELSVSAIMARSSNVGMAQLMVDVYGQNKKGWQQFSDDIQEIDYDKQFEAEICGMSHPVIRKYEEFEGWSKTTMTAMSRGYEVQSTPLYTLNFYNAIANDGYYVRPHLVSELRQGSEIIREFDTEKRSKRMCSRKTLEKIQHVLEGVVSREDGTAHRYVQSELFKVAGKTGTARYRKVGPGDDDYQYQISFVGYFPTDKPKYSAIVVFMCPRHAYTGLYCGTVFKTVAETIWAMGE